MARQFSIDITKVTKERLFEGKDGAKYVNLTFLPTSNDSTVAMIVESTSKTEREQGIQGNILGGVKKWADTPEWTEGPIKARVNINKLDQERLITGKKGGVYANLVLLESPTSEYNTHMIIESTSKEEREAGKKGAIIGNVKRWEDNPVQSQSSGASEDKSAANQIDEIFG